MKKNNNANDSFFKAHPWITHLLLMAVVSGVMLLLIAWALDIFSRNGSEKELPNFLGQTVEEAMEASGLDVEFVVTDSIYVDTLAGGRIAIQNPKGGMMVKEGRKVYVTLSKYSKEAIRMPDLRNRPLKQALASLEGAGLVCGRLTFVESYSEVHNLTAEVLNVYYKGRIVRHGDKVPQGSKIDLEVSRDDSYQPKVPCLIGLTPQAARKMLNSRCLNVGGENFQGSGDQSKMRVCRQEPAFSTAKSFQQGTSVELWFKEMSQDEVDALTSAAKLNAEAEQADYQEIDDAMTENVLREFEF